MDISAWGRFELAVFKVGCLDHFYGGQYQIVKHTKYHSSVQHVSLEVRVEDLRLGSVSYSCGG